jgi:hypothetical protein
MSDHINERAETRAPALQALAWVRERFPQARMSSLVIPSEEALIAVRIDISVPDGPAAAGHGVAMAIEPAEDRAIVRAAEGLGYRQPVAAQPEPRPAPRSIATAPVAEEPAPPAPIPVRPADPAPEPTPARSTTPAPLAGRSGQMGPPVTVRPRTQPTLVRGSNQPNQNPGNRSTLRPVPDPVDEDDGQLADVSWTEFWKWARSRGYDTREMVNDAIGRSMDGLSPRDVRHLLRQELGEVDD